MEPGFFESGDEVELELKLSLELEGSGGEAESLVPSDFVFGRADGFPTVHLGEKVLPATFEERVIQRYRPFSFEELSFGDAMEE